jgi:hypothetical protein
VAQLIDTCDRCDKEKAYGESFVRNLHEGYTLVCFECHQRLVEEETYGKEEKEGTLKEEG